MFLYSWIWDYFHNIAQSKNVTTVNTIYRPINEGKFSISGLIETISSPISSLCVSPFSYSDRKLVALGTHHGTLLVSSILYNLL